MYTVCTVQRITFFLLICGIFYINILMENGVRRRNFPIFSAPCKILFSELRRIIVILEQAPHHRSSISASRCEIKYLRLQITWNECCFTNNFLENKYILFFCFSWRTLFGRCRTRNTGCLFAVKNYFSPIFLQLSWVSGISMNKTKYFRLRLSYEVWLEFWENAKKKAREMKE